MALVVLVLAAALVVGWLRGGSLERLGALPLRRRHLVVLALVAQLAGAVIGGPAYPAGLALSAVLAVAFLVDNRGTRGSGLVGLGVAANALVVGANGAMPVSLPAADRAGVGVDAVVLGEDPRHELAGRGTRLRWLADVVPVPLPVVPQVVSPGDVLVAAGLGQLVVVGMGTRRDRSRAASGPAGAPATPGPAPPRPPSGPAGAPAPPGPRVREEPRGTGR